MDQLSRMPDGSMPSHLYKRPYFYFIGQPVVPLINFFSRDEIGRVLVFPEHPPFL